jgi:hypothetical protein
MGAWPDAAGEPPGLFRCVPRDRKSPAAKLLGRHGMIPHRARQPRGLPDVLRDPYARQRGVQITVCVDGAGRHKGAPAREFLGTLPSAAKGNSTAPDETQLTRDL